MGRAERREIDRRGASRVRSTVLCKRKVAAKVRSRNERGDKSCAEDLNLYLSGMGRMPRKSIVLTTN